ncbi:MAG TPA: phosphonate C-P lyase system protein PhnH [Reyranella sp.]|nr:phosphonate C-P lyase system protein PhnH [Reyranella sp.]
MTELAAGLADPAHDSQRLFRAVLEGFSHPGRIVALPQPPAGVGPLSAAATAFVLTLVDRDTPLWLAPAFNVDAVRDFVRFHTGASIVAREADALFAVVTPDRTPLLDGFAIGSDSYPDRSATLIVELPSLSTGPERFLRGPGIESRATARLAGLPQSFWNEWKANNALFPCGVDVVFTADSELLALPRSIAMDLENREA